MLDISGRRFGRWLVTGPAPKHGKHIMWQCRCDCGTEKAVLGFSLKSGGSTNCGCGQKEIVGRRATKHGMWKHPAYGSWKSMHARCKYPSNPGFPLYGGRGIKVCHEWTSFEGFWADMGPTWFLSGTIDRIDNDGNYEPGNCRWSTAKGQANNRRDNVAVQIGGEVMTLTQVAERFGIERHTLDARRRYGFDKTQLLRPVNSHLFQIATKDGVMEVAEAAAKYNLPVSTIYSRIKRGWPEAKILTPPRQRKQPNVE